MTEYINNGIKCSCLRIQKGERIYYKCSNEYDNIVFGAFDFEKAVRLMDNHLRAEIKKGKVHDYLFPPKDNEVRVRENFDEYYDKVIENLESKYCKEVPSRVRGVGLMLVKVCKCPFENGKLETYPRWLLHLENEHATTLENLAQWNIMSDNDFIGNLRRKEKEERDKTKSIEKSNFFDMLPSEDKTGKKIDEPLSRYYDEVMDNAFYNNCSNELDACICPLDDKKMTKYDFLRHLQSTHFDTILHLAEEHKVFDEKFPKTEKKANYKNGESNLNIEYVEYARAKPSITKPSSPDLVPLNGDRVDENEKEEGDNYNYISENRKAETHKYRGGSGIKRRKGRSQYYLSQKANFGNYSEEEKVKSRKSGKKGKKLGFDYAQFFDQDGSPEKSIKKLDTNNHSTVMPSGTIPQRQTAGKSENPAVGMAEGKKPKNKKRQLVDNNPTIYGIDQAAAFSH